MLHSIQIEARARLSISTLLALRNSLHVSVGRVQLLKITVRPRVSCWWSLCLEVILIKSIATMDHFTASQSETNEGGAEKYDSLER